MDTSDSSHRTKVLAEIVVFAALSAVLYAVRPYTLPFGGSITLGSMVPVMWLSLRRGVRVGVVTGVIFGALALLIDILFLGASSIIATPLQAVLEYPVAFGIVGLTGMFKRNTVTFAVTGAAVSVFIRFTIHYFVGVFIWFYVYTFPEQWGQWSWPAVYNGSFLSIEAAVSATLLAILLRRGTLEYGL